MKLTKSLYVAVLVVLMTCGHIVCGQSFVKTITYSDTVKDYGPVLSEAIKQVVKAGKGTVKIAYGVYPLLTAVDISVKSGDVDISLVGVRNKTGKLPVFQDTDSGRAPHHFFKFLGNAGNPRMKVSLSNLELVGNNVPYSPSHPFFGRPEFAYYIAISGLNVQSMKVDNVTIRNFYGRGILIASYFNTKFDKRHRVESPVVRNCQIMNVWGYSKKDDSGDGIEFYGANKPLVENNVVLNNLPDSKYVGRCGVVLERNTEKAVIRNNQIGGYARNIHIECDWGGHLIEKNNFSQSSIAVTLSEDCGQPDSLRAQFSPTIIRNNTMVYKQELTTYKIPKNPFSFISIHKPSFVLDGLQIVNNRMTIAPSGNARQLQAAKPTQEIIGKRYINTNGQNNVTIKGNSYN